MTAWEAGAVLALLAGLSFVIATLIAREPRVSPVADAAPEGMEHRLCATATCPVETAHLVLPRGAAVCAICGHENPATARSRRT